MRGASSPGSSNPWRRTSRPYGGCPRRPTARTCRPDRPA
jgi:hypothetical protein